MRILALALVCGAVCAAFALADAPAAADVRGAPVLAWPVRDPGADAITGPSYDSRKLELRLSPAAAASARASAAGSLKSGAARLTRLGVAALDRAIESVGGAWIEPEFAGERAPDPGSGETDFTAFYILHLAPGADLVAALTRLRALGEIASADPIGVLPVSAMPDDSLWSTSSWFYQPSRHDIHAPEAWDVTTGDTSIVVAVLDTGVLPNHPDLSGTVPGLSGQMWVNREERGGVTYLDDDGNGFVDDISGWDFVSLPSGDEISPGEDWQDQDNDPSDWSGHGTFVAGLVGAITNNGIGVSGTAWNVRLMPLRVAFSTLSDPAGLVDMSFVAQAIRYATRNGASVINCSFATLDQSGLGAAAAAAARAGATVVNAAGNFGSPHELGDREDVIAVAATDENDLVAGFSNLGDYVDLSAPGSNITSTWITRTGVDSVGQRQPWYTDGLSGTSFSAPMVSGAVALLQARQRALGARPLYPTGALLRLRETADDISALNAGTPGYGTGRLNLARALLDPPGSSANLAGAETSGPAVVLPRTSGRTVIAQVLFNQRLLLVDGSSGDTIRVQNLAGQPARQIAAADLGGGRGVGMFVGTLNGKVAGFDRDGTPLPGWPVSGATSFNGFVGGPALGSLDGDGLLEVVCGSNDGSVYAWDAGGTEVPGFPVALSPSGVNVPVALGDLDGVPGAEIVAADGDRNVHVLRGDGSELPGWPVGLSGTLFAPVIAHFGASVAIVVASDDSLIALKPDGGRRFAVALGGSAAQDPALADLAGDGADDVIVPLSAPNALAVFDGTGAALTSRNWPRALNVAPNGSPVVGALRPGGAGRDVAIMQGTALLALTDSARAIARFPEPGQAGRAPTLGDLDGSGVTRIVAGSGPDSVLYIYSAGPGTWQAGAPWPTARGNFARTGNRGLAPPLTPLDDAAPSQVADLVARFVPPDSVRLTWSAPGNDGTAGRATSYELHVTGLREQAQRFDGGGVRADLPAPDSSGVAQEFALRVDAKHGALFFALRARDAAGNISNASNVAATLTPMGGPTVAATLAVRAQPARVPVELEWTSPPGGSSRIDLYDIGGRRVRTLLCPEGVDQGRVVWNGRDDSGNRIGAGLYFARLTSGARRVTARVVLLP
jgi:hypothetical protein